MNDVASVFESIGGPASLPKIQRLQALMITALGDEYSGNTDDICPVKHHFAPGMYAREMFIPAGTVLVGKMHRKAHLVTLAKGRILVAGEGENKELVGPMTFVSSPLVKRVGYALEDTVWICYHLAETSDLEAIEADLIVPESEVLELAARMEALP